MAISSTHHRSALLVLYALTFAWGVIAAGIGINALVKSNHDKDRVRKTVPPPTIVHIDIKNIFDAGVVLAVVAALIALTSLFSFVMLARRRNATTPILRIASLSLAVLTLWLFATLIPYDHYYATGSAKVAASIKGIALPQSVIQAAEKATGVTAVYKHIHYVRILAITPWITFLFTGFTSVVSFIAARRAGDNNATESEDHVHDEKAMDSA